MSLTTSQQEVAISRKWGNFQLSKQLVPRLHQVWDFYDLTAGDRKVDDPEDTHTDNLAVTRLHTRSGGRLITDMHSTMETHR